MDTNSVNLGGPTTEVVKMEVDHSTTCDEKIPEFEKLAKSGKLTEAIEGLISLEKQTRTGGDMISTGRVLVTVVQLCRDVKNWVLLNENINLLAKRRGQLKQAVAKMVQEACTYIDILETKELKYELIATLRSVTEGKIYVEVERARLTQKLANMKEKEGDIEAAATIMQELQVETYGSMEKREKVEFILEQMRLCLAIKDYIRTQIISKKINVKFFEDVSAQDLKITYYKLMIENDQHDSNFLSICRHYRAVLKTPKIQENEEEKKDILRAVVLYLILSPYDNEQAELVHILLEDKAMETIPTYKTLLALFKNQELINWKDLGKNYETELHGKTPSSAATDVFSDTELGKQRSKKLKDRVVEHNIRIMAKYYTRVTLRRMSELLDLPSEEVEEVLCSMVVAGTVQGKTDRPAGIVSFQSSKDPSELLNDWSHNLNTLMSLISRTTHLINKEEMVHKHLLGSAPVTIGAGPSGSNSAEVVPMDEG